jgi:hypothetical protein
MLSLLDNNIDIPPLYYNSDVVVMSCGNRKKNHLRIFVKGGALQYSTRSSRLEFGSNPELCFRFDPSLSFGFKARPVEP